MHNVGFHHNDRLALQVRFGHDDRVAFSGEGGMGDDQNRR